MKVMNYVRKITMSVVCIALVLVVQACGNGGPTPINYGHEQCGHCRMTVSDARFGCQLVTKKGRTYTFDDVQCLVEFVKEGGVAKEEVAEYYLPDYTGENRLLPAGSLFLLRSEALKSPMRGDIAAFATEADRAEIEEITQGGETLTWEDVWK